MQPKPVKMMDLPVIPANGEVSTVSYSKPAGGLNGSDSLQRPQSALGSAPLSQSGSAAQVILCERPPNTKFTIPLSGMQWAAVSMTLGPIIAAVQAAFPRDVWNTA